MPPPHLLGSSHSSIIKGFLVAPECCGLWCAQTSVCGTHIFVIQRTFSLIGLLQMAFIIVAGICACLYFLFLCFMVYQVFQNIGGKQSSLPAMTKARRLHYEVGDRLDFFLSLVYKLYCKMTLLSKVGMCWGCKRGQSTWKFYFWRSLVDVLHLKTGCVNSSLCLAYTSMPNSKFSLL